MTHVAVIDVGKTNAKLALVDLADMAELAVVTRPNTVLPGPPWPHFDLEGHWAFFLDELAAFHGEYGVDAIVATTHGASIVLLDEAGDLAAPMIDYEFDGPDEIGRAYDVVRPGFADTGSPRLAVGLNVGAQLYYMLAKVPGLKDRTATIVTYPQYWGFRLTGKAALEVTSLGAHTDLWEPHKRRLSRLALHLGLKDRFAPLGAATDVLGAVLPEIAEATGLRRDTPVYSGIHDSNASLLPYVLGREPPFSVVSTGTWVISMTMGGAEVALDPERDTLINVNALGDPVPSARFMGGREHDILSEGHAVAPTAGDIEQVLRDEIMRMPSVLTDTGPFQGREGCWIGEEPEVGSGRRAAAVGFYLALVTAEGLRLTGHRGDILVEGPFARNQTYLDMLSAATNEVVYPSLGSTGTSQGAALLALPDGQFKLPEMKGVEHRSDARYAAYANAWRRCVET